MFVFFDVGGTLLGAPRDLADVVDTLLLHERLVRSSDAIQEGLRVSGAAGAEGSLSSSDPGAFEALFRELDLAADAPRLARALAHRAGAFGVPALVPGARAALEMLRGSGVRLGVISNADETLPEILEFAGIARYLSVTMSSARAGFAKPDRRIFEAALAEAGVKASDAWHVGDDPVADVRGARDAGLRAVWITGAGASSVARADTGVLRAARVDEAAYRILEAEGRISRDGAA